MCSLPCEVWQRNWVTDSEALWDEPAHKIQYALTNHDVETAWKVWQHTFFGELHSFCESPPLKCPGVIKWRSPQTRARLTDRGEEARRDMMA